MVNKIRNKQLLKIDEEITFVMENSKEGETALPQGIKDDVKMLLSVPSFKNLVDSYGSLKFWNNLTYEDIYELDDVVGNFKHLLNELKTRAEIKEFLQGGYKIDVDELRASFRTRGIANKHPNFNFERLAELYEKPPRYLETDYCVDRKRLNIQINDFVFRKFIISIIQMVFNEMDLLIVYSGAEGSGKSTKCSQDMWIFHWLLTELGIIDYKFDIKEMFFNTLAGFQEHEDKYFGDKFRILGLDEGNQLHRQNWKDEEVRLFFERLRRERKQQRIKMICIPVLGEMMTAIVQNRVNFVFDGYMKNKTQTGELLKGYWKMYVIPRGGVVYSPSQKRNITSDEIRSTLQVDLKDQNYRKGISSNLVIKHFRSNGVWGFREEDYVKFLKETNEDYTVSKGIKFGDLELYGLYKCNITLKKVGMKSKDPLYHSTSKALTRIRNYWEKNPEKLVTYDKKYERRIAEKDSASLDDSADDDFPEDSE